MENDAQFPEEMHMGIQVITIVLDENEDAPKIDLGTTSIADAISVFRAAANALEEVLPVPTITQYGDVITSDFYIFDESDDDD